MSNNTLGERIKHHRKRLNLTQEQLAERLGVSAQAVSKWENNLACPDISILPVLAEVFGISTDELLGLKAAETPPVHEAEVVGTSDKAAKKREKSALRKKIGSLLFAFYILTCGALMLVNHYCGFDVSWWTVLWTLGICYLGISFLCNKLSVFNVAVTAAGVYFLLSSYNLSAFTLSWDVLLPGVLLLWGLSMLIDSLFGKKPIFSFGKKHNDGAHAEKNKSYDSCRCDGGYVRCEMSMGERRTAVVTPLLRGGTVEANFGNFSVDFSGCEAIAPDCTIEVENNFASLTFLMPSDYRVNVLEDDSFSAHIEIEGAPAANPKGSLNIELDNSFGTFIIRYVD